MQDNKEYRLRNYKEDFIGDFQEKLLEKSIRYIKRLENKSVNVHSSTFAYLNSWANVPGYVILDFWGSNIFSLFKNYLIIVKSYLGISSLHSFKIKASSFTEKNAEKLIVSWCKKEDFTLDGYFDRYFKIYDKDVEKSIWFLISLDNYVPSKIPNNVIIFYQENVYFKYNTRVLLTYTLKIILKHKFSISKIIHHLSSATIYSEIVAKNLINETAIFPINSLFIPYEAQPLQNTIIKQLKSNNQSIKTIGYLHSSLPPLMTDFIFRDGSPDKLFVHGKGQISILKNRLLWPADKLCFTNSLRYRLFKNFEMNSFIFLPYDFFNINLYIEEFKIFLSKSEQNSLPLLKIRNHPVQNKSKKHLKLIDAINKLIIKFSDRFSIENERKVSFFIGATASIIEALEQKIEVIHITSNPLFEKHSNKIWNNITVENVSHNVFIYTLKEYGTYISKGPNNDIFSINGY